MHVLNRELISSQQVADGVHMTDELCVHTYVYCYRYSVCMYWHISTSHSGWGIFLHYYTNILLRTFVVHVCSIAMDL